MLARICVDALRVTCVIGCLDAERRIAQEIEANLWVELDITAPARSDALDHTWNYAAIADQVDFILGAGRFWLLESAAHVLLHWLLLPPSAGEDRPPTVAAGVSLTKFGVLPGAARPRVSVQAQAASLSFGHEVNPWGTVDVVAETERLGLYRLNVAPGQRIPNHVHRRMKEHEYVLTDGILGWRNNRAPTPLSAGTRRDWALDEPHGYHNASERVASILCLDRPRFDPTDEVVVPGGPA